MKCTKCSLTLEHTHIAGKTCIDCEKLSEEEIEELEKFASHQKESRENEDKENDQEA